MCRRRVRTNLWLPDGVREQIAGRPGVARRPRECLPEDDCLVADPLSKLLLALPRRAQRVAKAGGRSCARTRPVGGRTEAVQPPPSGLLHRS